MTNKQPHVELTPDLIPELNATFYTSEPAQFLRQRVQSLLLLLKDDDVLAAARQATAKIGILSVGGGGLLESREEREQFVAIESTILFHHAAETLLRLFLAHRRSKPCPWLEVAELISFSAFKQQVSDLLSDTNAKWDRDEIAAVFLGGTTPADAAIDIEAAEFDETIDAIIDLLSFGARRLLSDAFLYNAAKHGLSGVPLDGTTKLGYTSSQGEKLHAMSGAMIAHLHKMRSPKHQRQHQAEWYTTMTNVLIDQDLVMVEMFARVIDSLWAVARRRYLGLPGEVNLFQRSVIHAMICEPIKAADQHIRVATFELPTTTTERNGKQKTSAVQIHLTGPEFPRSYMEKEQKGGKLNGTPRSVALPLRDRDRDAFKNYGAGEKYYLPFSPKLSAFGPDEIEPQNAQS